MEIPRNIVAHFFEKYKIIYYKIYYSRNPLSLRTCSAAVRHPIWLILRTRFFGVRLKNSRSSVCNKSVIIPLTSDNEGLVIHILDSLSFLSKNCINFPKSQNRFLTSSLGIFSGINSR
eukprot:NODE_831_length_3642_cov_0.596669.p4 type:complete len:118 gc:universal NODE_831_length_3642_cov_0.596669:2454-2101(-)